jgi:uncharacterized membrane protein
LVRHEFALIMDARPDNAVRPVVSARWLAALAVVAAMVASYLAWGAWSQRGLPVGCGEHGGCAEVLGSRWSALRGIPVGAIALPIYLAVGWAALRSPSPWGGRVLSFAAAVLVAAAVWFVWLQAAVVRAFCPWCLFEHALGLVLAGLAVHQLRATRAVPENQRVWLAAMLGILSVAGLATVQYFQPSVRSIVRSPAEPDRLAPTDGSTISLLQGHLRLAVNDDPWLGDAAAPHRLYLMFDYCCPHCRRTHGYLLEALAARSHPFSVVCLPAPRDADCNPAITQTEERFEHACELAKLALAVWRAKPEAFAEFDRWLFAPSQPPRLEAARRKAVELVSAELLEAHRDGEDVQRKIARNVQAFNDSHVEYLPVMMSPGMDTIEGRPESREALLAILIDELFSNKSND